MINWKVRFKNPVFISLLATFIVNTIYQLLSMFEIAPTITQDSVLKTISSMLELLTLAGILVDPTTKGINDSERALTYDEPN